MPIERKDGSSATAGMQVPSAVPHAAAEHNKYPEGGRKRSSGSDFTADPPAVAKQRGQRDFTVDLSR